MKTLSTFLLFTILSGSLHAATPQKLDRWTVLMTLVSKEMKILENAKRKGPELKYRMLELHSERLKLIHEKNNQDFMEKSKVANVNKNKESFFKETREYYQYTKEFGNKLLKEYPDARRRAEVLYAMGLNSRDYGRDNIAEKYLLETISLVKDPHHSLRHHAETALADFYYNEKRFQDAIGYYEKVIKKTEDEWLPKHYFNLSWCYLKVREFDKAIKAIRDSYTLSKNRIYVNINDQVLDNIGSFYVYAGRPMEGLEFYLKNEKDPIPYLMPMAKKTSEKGHEKETEEILEAAQKLVDKNDWFHYQEELFHSYLDFYRHYNRFSDHEETSRKMVGYYKKADTNKELKLKTELKEDTIEKMRSLAGFLQVKLAKNMKEDGGSFKEQEMSIVLNFFNHLIALDPKNKVEYLYFRGETYYSVRRFLDAAPAYIDCVNEAKLVKNEALARKGLDSLLALTGMEVIEKKLNDKYLVFAYSEHVGIWPRDAKSEQIYPKLFEIYRESGLDEKASSVVRIFNKAYPEHLKDQQTLMTKVLDMFIERKETKKLASWIHEFKSGFLSFSRETIEKTEITLGNMLFLEYQGLAKKGDKIAAAKGFESIYENKLYTDKVKSQAAFYAALTYIELSQTENSYKWHVLAFDRMNSEERMSKRDEQLKMAERTYKLQDFVTSYKMSEYFLKKYCSLKDDIQNRYFEVAVMTALVEENTEGAENIIRLYSNCLKKPESRENALSQMYAFYEKKGDFRGLRLHVYRYPSEEFKNQYRFTLQKWYWERSSLNLKEQIRQEFKDLKHPEATAWLKEMDQFKQAEKSLAVLKNESIWDLPAFDGEAYNKALEKHLLGVQSFKQKYQNLTSSTQTDLAILSTRMFSALYLNLGEKISGIKPLGMDPQTYKEFNAAMKQVAGQFLTVSRQFDHQLEKALKEKETLAWGSRSIASVENVENPVFSFFTGLTMDKSREE
jgi:tetratricopeptide (TPR) repeat protein